MGNGNSLEIMTRKKFFKIIFLIFLFIKIPFKLFSKTKKKGKFCMVFDDAGGLASSVENLKKLAKENLEITVAIIAYSNHEEEIFDVLANYENAEIILHQAMECVNMEKRNLANDLEKNPRKKGEKYVQEKHSAIYDFDSTKLAISIIDNNIKHINNAFEKRGSYKKIIGLNNHMGSLVSKNKNIVRSISLYCYFYDLILFDSKSGDESIIYEEAKKLNVKTCIRNYDFIDGNTKEKLEIAEKMIKNGENIITIGHLNYRGTIRLYIEHAKKSEFLNKLSEFFNEE